MPPYQEAGAEEHPRATATKAQDRKKQLRKHQRPSSESGDGNKNRVPTKYSKTPSQKPDVQDHDTCNDITPPDTSAPATADGYDHPEGTPPSLDWYDSIFLPTIIENPRPTIHRHALPTKSCLKASKEDGTDKPIASLFGCMSISVNQLDSHHKQHNDTRPTARFSTEAACIITGETFQPCNRDRREWKSSGRPHRHAWREERDKAYAATSRHDSLGTTRQRSKVLRTSCSDHEPESLPTPPQSPDNTDFDSQVEYQLSIASFLRIVYRISYLNMLQIFRHRWMKHVELEGGQETCLKMPEVDTRKGRRRWRILMDKEQAKGFH
ncbi:hypothetical protein B0T21DRAFT_415259 [Apiosordaria backusii]|uniref:Uncharacterized protein n=1 Tax=Apiosordaria backusii TaxID=314023 RepID=A0AA40AIR3_9PEZI|nr:hypothetical protein B0T21DRAFT_415259 [Apiosordaria backusii]